MARILVIAPYSGLKDLFLEVNADLKKQIQVEVGDLYKGLSIAKEMEDEEFDVIISRGATAHLLRQHCNIPVIEMKISGYDIFRTLTLVKGYPGKIGLMSYFNTIEGADVVGTLLEMDLSFYPIDREDDIESGIRKSIEEGVQVIIGDVITTTTAANFGLHSILIISGRESVIAAIEEAEQVAYYTKKEKKERQFFEAIASSYHEGMIAVDNTGKVQLLNKQAEIYLGTNEKELVGEQIEKINPLLSVTDILSGRKEDTEEVCTLYGEDFVLRKRALYDNKDLFGGVIFLERAEEVQRVESQIRHRLFSNQSTAKAHFNQLVAINENVKLQIENAYKLSRNDLAVLIYGEPGSGKQSLAQAIHNESSRKGSPFVFLNCEAYSE
ncbi:MAG TPA: PrpR N-terminal domain-containing protein, partial [Chondromyces sp.]|nr:PrpR N-terminal domain-containing protein [Chondromyces sp.]